MLAEPRRQKSGFVLLFVRRARRFADARVHIQWLPRPLSGCVGEQWHKYLTGRRKPVAIERHPALKDLVRSQQHHFPAGIRRRSSSTKFNRKVTWTEPPFADSLASGAGNTAKRLPSGATSRFTLPLESVIGRLAHTRGFDAEKESPVEM